MGLIRKSGLILIVFLVLINIFMLGLFFTIQGSLDYSNVQTKINEVVVSLISQSGISAKITELLPSMNLYCVENSDYVFNYETFTLAIPCETISQGEEAIYDYAIGYTVENIYFKEYSCGYWECFATEKLPFFLVSQFSKDYWRSMFYYSLFSLLIFLGLGFLFVEDKSNFFVLFGALFFVESFIFYKIEFAISLVSGLILGVVGVAGVLDVSFLSEILMVFFSGTWKVFLIFFLLGILLLFVGIFLKFVFAGKKIGDIFSGKKKFSKDEVKNIVKEEIGKSKKNL